MVVCNPESDRSSCARARGSLALGIEAGSAVCCRGTPQKWTRCNKSSFAIPFGPGLAATPHIPTATLKRSIPRPGTWRSESAGNHKGHTVPGLVCAPPCSQARRPSRVRSAASSSSVTRRALDQSCTVDGHVSRLTHALAPCLSAAAAATALAIRIARGPLIERIANTCEHALSNVYGGVKPSEISSGGGVTRVPRPCFVVRVQYGVVITNRACP
ncbi:hypothetical protein AB1N83_014039 [Pleurotus pulmonarius]